MQEINNLLNFQLFIWNEYQLTVGQLLVVPTFVILGVLLTKWLVRVLVKRMASREVEPDVIHLVKRIFYILAIIILVISTLEMINVPLTAFAFVSGAIAIGFGFGAQNIINNFISGWILMWERPIRIGDFLEIDGVSRGTVETINTRSTRIKRVDGVRMLIPNSKLLENTVVNWTLIDRLMRTSVRVGVAYGSPTRRTADLIMEAAKAQESVLETPPPVVIFDDFGDNALMFEVFFWVNATKERDLRVIRSEIRFAIDELFNAENIVIAYPQRDVHVDGSLLVQHTRSHHVDRVATPAQGAANSTLSKESINENSKETHNE